jgi:hypothetical protein
MLMKMRIKGEVDRIEINKSMKVLFDFLIYLISG